MARRPGFILVVGDSLSAERNDGIPWERLWPQILASNVGTNFVISNKSRGAATSRTLRNQEVGGVDLAIIQLGIVDCVPRYFTTIENALIARIPYRLRSKIIDYFKSRRIQERSRAYVGADEYKRNLEIFLKRVDRAIIVRILEPGQKFGKSNPNAAACISEYNLIIDDLARKHNDVKVVGVPLELIDTLTLDDGYHLNEEGHLYMARLLMGALESKKLKVLD